MLVSVAQFRELSFAAVTATAAELYLRAADAEVVRRCGQHYVPGGTYIAHYRNFPQRVSRDLPPLRTNNPDRRINYLPAVLPRRVASLVGDSDNDYYVQDYIYLYRKDGQPHNSEFDISFVPVNDNDARAVAVAKLALAEVHRDGYESTSELSLTFSKTGYTQMRNEALALVYRYHSPDLFNNHAAFVTEPSSDDVPTNVITSPLIDTWWYSKESEGVTDINLAQREPIEFAETLAVPGAGYLVYARAASHGIPTFTLGGFTLTMVRYPNDTTINGNLIDIYVSEQYLLETVAGSLVTISYGG